MKRIEKIYNYIVEESKGFLLKDIEAGKGFSAG